MFLEYDWTSDTYRSRLSDAFTAVAHSFPMLAAARHDLRLIGLRIGAKTEVCTWRLEFMESVPALKPSVWEVGLTGITVDGGWRWNCRESRTLKSLFDPF
jgi:hypothetical protein